MILCFRWADGSGTVMAILTYAEYGFQMKLSTGIDIFPLLQMN